jgi:hypothetical protein
MLMDGLMDAYALQSPEPSSLSCIYDRPMQSKASHFLWISKHYLQTFGRTPYCKVSTYTGQHKQQKCRHTSTPQEGSESIILVFKYIPQATVINTTTFLHSESILWQHKTPGYLTFPSYMLFQSSLSVNKSIKD